jgi:hypothetical protein
VQLLINTLGDVSTGRDKNKVLLLKEILHIEVQLL